MLQSRKFILKQATTLLRLGFSQADVDRTIAWTEKHCPEGADAATWIPTAADLSADLLNEAAVQDAKTAWRADKNVPRRFKGILDARLTK